MKIDSPLSLRDLIAATPEQVNPHLAITAAACEQYARDTGIWLPNYADYHSMAAYMFPRADYERYRTIALLMDLLWFIDDYFDRSRLSDTADDDHALRDELMRGVHVLTTGSVDHIHSPWHRACYDLHVQVNALGGSAWLARLVASLASHLQATTFSLDHIMHAGVPNVERYIAVREHDSGMLVAIECIELACGITLSDTVRTHPAVAAMRRECANVGGLLNDLVSYHKEIDADDYRFNLLHVLMEGESLSFPQAAARGIAIVNGCISRFLALADAPLQFTDPADNVSARRYIEGMRDQVGASLHWQLTTNRYRSTRAPFTELTASAHLKV